MGTTRRGFLGGVLGLLAGPAAAMAARKERVEVEPDIWEAPSSEFGPAEWERVEALRHSNPWIIVSDATAGSGTIHISGLNEYGEMVVETMGTGQIVSAIDVEPNPDPLFRLLGREK